MIGLRESLPMRLVARAEGGYTDEISGKEAAWIPSDAYFVNVDENTMGMMYPANRQAVSRWVRRQEAGEAMGPSEYLQDAIGSVSSTSQIVVALDTQDVSQPHLMKQRLTESAVVTSRKLNVNELIPVLSSMQGITLSLSITDKVSGTAQINFGEAVNFDSQTAKAFVTDAMTNFGAEIPGLEKWSATVSGNAIQLSGDLDTSGLRRILSFLEIPSTKFSSLKDEETGKSSAEEIKTKSLAYFQTITKLIDDLQQKSKSSRGDNYWFDRYAQKIDRLPILHVDGDLLDFGQKTAETLRVMSGSRKTANIQGGLAVSNEAASGGSYGNYNYGYGNSGYYGGGPVNRVHQDLSGSLARVNAAKNNAAAGATATKIQGFQLINNATVEIRRTLTERYNVEF